MSPDGVVIAPAALTPELAWAAAPDRLELGRAEVHLWRAATAAADSGELARAWHVLDVVERHRALCYRDDRAARAFVVARAALRVILGRYLECDPADVTLEQERGGRPRLRSHTREHLSFSASRAGGVALVAVVAAGEVGVDVERVPREDSGAGLPWRVVRENAPPELLRDLGDAEDPETFCVAWTRLEAYAKAFTDGLAGASSASAIGLPEGCRPRSFRVDEELVGSLVKGGAVLRQLSAFEAPPAARP
jgi:4'-phosphopantetheinyl transferase